MPGVLAALWQELFALSAVATGGICKIVVTTRSQGMSICEISRIRNASQMAIPGYGRL